MKRLVVAILTGFIAIASTGVCAKADTITLSDVNSIVKDNNTVSSNRVHISQDVEVSVNSLKDDYFEVVVKNNSDLPVNSLQVKPSSNNNLKGIKIGVQPHKVEPNTSEKFTFLFTPSKNWNIVLSSLWGIAIMVSVLGIIYISGHMIVVGFSSKLGYVIATSLLIVSAIPAIAWSVNYNVPTSEGTKYCQSASIENKSGKLIFFDIDYKLDDVYVESTEKVKEVDFEVEYEYDDTLPCNVKSTLVEGIKGSKMVTKDVTYTNNKKTDTKTTVNTLVSPTNKIIKQGTQPVTNVVSVEPKKVYVPDNTLEVGEEKLMVSQEEYKSCFGKQEVTTTFNKETNSTETTEKLLEKPKKVNVAVGTLLKETQEIKPTIEYILREDKPISYRNVIKEPKSAEKVFTYEVEIDTLTGKPKNSSPKKLVDIQESGTMSGEIEIGLLKEVEKISKLPITYIYDDTLWDNYKNTEVEGVSKKVKEYQIMDFDEETGTVLNSVKEIKGEETINGGTSEIIRVGTKQPTWVEEKETAEVIDYITIYKEDVSLSGGDAIVEREGKQGSLITTNLVAVDSEGNRIDSYSPKKVDEELVEPVNAIVRVASDSPKLSK